MNELTQEKSCIHASIVKNALADHQFARDMNVLTQVRSLVHASIVINAFAGYQLALQSNVKQTMQ